jgi:prevent-host-death family protein
MASGDKRETTVGVTDFKAHCLTLIERVARGDVGRVLLSKRGKPVAAVVPLQSEPAPLWGAMRGTVTVVDGTDLTKPTGEIWSADS